MWIKRGELLHSFIFRKLLSVNAYSLKKVTRQIVSHHFYWKSFPKLDKDYQAYFSQYNVQSLYDLTKLHTKAKFVRAIATPESLIDVTSSIFYEVKSHICLPKNYINPNQRDQEIRYCSYCFKEQIERDGYPWFKLSWLIGHHCKKHSAKLIKFACNCNINELDSCSKLISIYRGYCDRCKASTWTNPPPAQATSNQINFSYSHYISPILSEQIDYVMRSIYEQMFFLAEIMDYEEFLKQGYSDWLIEEYEKEINLPAALPKLTVKDRETVKLYRRVMNEGDHNEFNLPPSVREHNNYLRIKTVFPELFKAIEESLTILTQETFTTPYGGVKDTINSLNTNNKKTLLIYFSDKQPSEPKFKFIAKRNKIIDFEGLTKREWNNQYTNFLRYFPHE